LVKPATYVVAFGRSLKSNFTLIIRRVETCAHNIETERPELIAKVKDLAIDDIFIRLYREPVCFGQICDMDPGPPSFTIAAEDRLALFRHREPIRADAVETIVPEHEARSEDDRADVCEGQRLSFEASAEGKGMIRIWFGPFVHDGNWDLAENRAPGRINEPSSRRSGWQRLQGGEQRTIGIKRTLLVQHGVYDHVAALQFGAICPGFADIAAEKRDLLHSQNVQTGLFRVSDKSGNRMSYCGEPKGGMEARISRDSSHEDPH
jgi:hypothetical protein